MQFARAEQFSLRWNDFHAHLSSGFHALLEGADLVDVTLAAGGQYLQAHKLILSVCSPYFKDLFKVNPCRHPIVILKDVQPTVLRHILQFMYKGQVNVKKADLQNFLRTAELLQVKGLTVNREKSPTPPADPESEDQGDYDQTNNEGSLPDSIQTKENSNDAVVREEEPKSPLKRLLTSTPRVNSQPKQKVKQAAPVESPIQQEISEYMCEDLQIIDCDSEIYHSILEIPETAKESRFKQDGWNCKIGGVKCPSCNRFFANRYNLKVHIRDKHDTTEGTLQCEICQKRMRNQSCLRVHLYHHRKQAAFLATQVMPSMDVSGEADLPTQGHEFDNSVGNTSAFKKRKPEAALSSSQPNEHPQINRYSTAAYNEVALKEEGAD